MPLQTAGPGHSLSLVEVVAVDWLKEHKRSTLGESDAVAAAVVSVASSVQPLDVMDSARGSMGWR